MIIMSSGENTQTYEGTYVGLSLDAANLTLQFGRPDGSHLDVKIPAQEAVRLRNELRRKLERPVRKGRDAP
jgi:hypothetical protein